MKQLLRETWLVVSCITTGLLDVAASCDDDDREPGAPFGTGDGTRNADFGLSTVDNDDEGVEPEANVASICEDAGTRSISELPAPETRCTPAITFSGRTVAPCVDIVDPQGVEHAVQMSAVVDLTWPDDDGYEQIVGLDYSITDIDVTRMSNLRKSRAACNCSRCA